MRLAKFLSAVAVASMATVPAIAAPSAPAAKLSVTKSVRASTPAGDANELRGGFIIPVIAIIAIILGILAATGGGGSRPNSP